MSKYINTGEIVHYSTPKRQNSAKSPEKTANTEVVYDNPSFDSILPEDTQVKNLQTLLKTQEAVKKWKHFQRRRRTINQRDSVVTPSHSNHINSEICGLDDESTDAELNAFDKTPKQANTQKRSLNKQLISYFVKLAKNNHEDDEVDFEFIEELLGKGADVNCCDKYGQSMLHEAAREWHTDIVLFLLDHGANIKCVDKFGRSLLHVAAAVDYPDMVELLVEKGCDIEAVTNKELQTPLHYAARNDAVASLKILLKLGAETEAKDYKQRTPLFVAAELDRSETAKFLVETNANATIIDQSGQLCMTHMITKMGPVANNALDQFHKKDRANRKQYYFLNLLETPRSKNGKSTIAKNPLEVIVTYRQLDLIMHPAIMRLIDVKWNLFGRTAAFRNLLLNFVFILIWTVLGVAVPWQTRYLYRFPQDWWRVVLLLCGCIMTIYYVFAEINEIIASKRRFRRWKSWREEQIKEDLNFCHPKWPEEKRYLEGEVKTLDEMLPAYFQDFWNYFDWTVYFLIFVLVITHIIDTSITPNAPCCTYTNNSAVLCDDPAVTLCATGFVNNLNLGVWNNRIFVFTIIFLWLRIMKYTRAFRFLGPFIVMLGKIVWDILRFFYLYLEFYIPYACAFWMIFGRIESISSMFTVDQLLFSLYRITLVDEYQYNEMRAFDVVMAYILIGTFLGVSAILCINLFIALLSDTFQRVYDNANANAVMQQAALILNIEENLSKKKKKRFLRHIEDNCSPECLYYDDDLTVLDGTDLKKVTIQIKDQMDELLEYVHKAETEQRLANDSTDFNSRQRRLSTVNTTPLSGALGLQVAGDGGFKSSLGFSSSNSEFGIMLRKMTEISFKLERIQMSQMAQEESYRRLRADVREVKRRLDVVHPEGVVVEDAWNRGGSRANSFTPTRLFNRPDVQLSPVAEQPQSPDSSSSDTPSSIFFRKTAGSRSGLTKTNNRTEDKASLLSRIVTSKLQDRESPRPSLPHVVDLVTLQGITESSDLTRRKPPGTIAGVRTVDLTVNVPSEELGTRGFPSDSHV